MNRGSGRGDDDRQVADTEFAINIQADTQSEPAQIVVNAGICELQMLYHDGKVTMPVVLTLQTSTGLHRGVHMSRLVQAASSRGGPSLEEWLGAICREVDRTQPGSRVSCRLEVPYSDQFIPVTISRGQKGAIRYQFNAKGMTACPCSRSMIGIGHMQRAEITMVIDGKKSLDIIQTIEKLEECFSAVPQEKMKRIEEAQKILEAQQNTRFAEDLVRECVKRFPNSLYVRSRCFESIHAHDAVATWSKKEDWMPAL